MQRVLVGVVVADALVAHSLETLGQSEVGIVLLGTWPSVVEAVDAWDVAVPDVALVGSELLRPDPVVALQLLRRSSPPTLIRHPRPTVDYAAFVLAAGAHGLLDAAARPETVAEAVREVATGSVPLPEHVRPALLGSEHYHRRPPALGLSSRQREVVLSAADGATAKQIGDLLFMTPATVRTHLQAAFRALGVDNRVAAARRLEHLGFGVGST